MNYRIFLLGIAFSFFIGIESLAADETKDYGAAFGGKGTNLHYRMVKNRTSREFLKDDNSDDNSDDSSDEDSNRETRFKRMVPFGDSLSDSGNYFIDTREFTVRPFDSIPTEPYLIGQLHFSNGKTWIERLATSRGSRRSGLPSLAVPKFFTNYAVGRARARSVPALSDFPSKVDRFGFPEPSDRFDFPEQVDRFLEDFGRAPPNRLYVVWIGANDVRDAFEAFFVSPGEADAIATKAIVATANGIIRLHRKGAKNFFVLNIPNLATTPAIAELGPPFTVIAEQLTEGYNLALERDVLDLLEQLFEGDINIIRMDVFELLNTVVANPEAFGLSNVTDSCITPDVIPGAICKNPNQYLFWDFIHPTRKAHEIIAKEAENILDNHH